MMIALLHKEVNFQYSQGLEKVDKHHSELNKVEAGRVMLLFFGGLQDFISIHNSFIGC